MKSWIWWYAVRPWRVFWKQRLPWWLAYKLPQNVVYFASIRLMVHGTTGQYSNQVVPELRAMDALERWGSP